MITLFVLLVVCTLSSWLGYEVCKWALRNDRTGTLKNRLNEEFGVMLMLMITPILNLVTSVVFVIIMFENSDLMEKIKKDIIGEED